MDSAFMRLKPYPPKAGCVLILRIYKCRHIKNFHNSPNGVKNKVYLLVDKLTVRVGIHSPLYVLETGD